SARRLFPPGHPSLLLPLSYLASAEMQLNNLAQAESLFREVLEGYEAQMPGTPVAALARVKLGGCLTRREQVVEAEKELLAAQANLAKANGAPPNYLASARKGLVSLYTKWGKPDDAEKWKESPPP